ncbi:M13-type metalloendopeptidase [Gordonia alkanivorans]|uniref:M13-type metalloendopeptidase n=1 Tax=Gordonia alkanivorans TaxID=84096 RepID=UPI001F4E23F4|nr:M13-type metalloendopeptidase [Gordonia alkanivorans]
MRTQAARVTDDYYLHVNSAWLERHVMPRGISIDGAFRDAWQLAEDRVWSIVSSDAEDTSVFRFWSAAITAPDPLTAWETSLVEEFQVIETLRSPSDIPHVLAELHAVGIDTAWELTVRTDRSSKRKLELGEPNRLIVKTVLDDVCEPAGRFRQSDGMLPFDAPEALAVDLELGSACRTFDPEDSAESSLADLIERAPDFDWPAWLGMQGISEIEFPTVHVTDIRAVAAAANTLTAQEPSALRSWLRSRVIRCRFRQLRGDDTREGRQRACLRLTERFFGEAILYEYHRRFVDDSCVAEAMAIALDVRSGMLEIIRAMPLSAGGKRHLVAKIEEVTLRIGLPDTRDIRYEFGCSTNAYINLREAFRAERSATLAVRHWSEVADWDRGRAYSATGYYSRNHAELLIPWGLLEKPFFSRQASRWANMGTFGCIVGHELAHSVDLDSEVDFGSGSQSALSESDLRRVTSWLDRLAEQCEDGFFDPTVRLEYSVDPTRVLNEALCDHVGVWAAAVAAGSGRDGQIPRQAMREFFRAYVTMMRSVATDAELDDRLLDDPHPPAEVRCNWVLRNLDHFHQAYGTRELDRMWVDPDQRLCRAIRNESTDGRD